MYCRIIINIFFTSGMALIIWLGSRIVRRLSVSNPCVEFIRKLGKVKVRKESNPKVCKSKNRAQINTQAKQ